MKRILVLALMLVCCSTASFAEYKSNYWASWANVSSQITWTFPFKTREINVHNGSSIPVCVSFNGATITAANSACTSPVGFASGLDNKVFQVGANQTLLLQDFVTGSITLQSAGAAASPISVVVTY